MFDYVPTRVHLYVKQDKAYKYLKCNGLIDENSSWYKLQVRLLNHAEHYRNNQTLIW
jgi:hypothetical protein